MERVVLWHRCFPPTRAELDSPELVERWLEELGLRAYTVGGTALARVGGSIAIAFGAHDLEAAIDLALDVLDEVEDGALGGLPVAIGVGMGMVQETAEGPLGSAIDRAQLLANRARQGELVVDAATREIAEAIFLFDRGVGTGAAALRGTTVDRKVPRRATARLSVAYLAKPRIPERLREELGRIEELARSDESACVVLRAPSGAGATGYLAVLEDELEPPMVLHVAGVPGALEPLGSLRFALKRALEERADPPEALADVVAKLVDGEPPPREELERILVEGFGAMGRPWLFVDPIGLVDVETMRLIASIARSTPLFVSVRSAVEAPLPAPLQGLPFESFVLPPLRSDDAKAVARTILGEAEDADIVRRVAVLGGDTVVGIEEAARTLVASGDLVHDGDAFRWRVKARTGARAIPIDALLQERLASLEELPMRMLETVCVCPQGTSASELGYVAEADGLDEGRQEEALSRLKSEALVDERNEPSSEHLRQMVVISMPPARLAELHRFLADAIASQSAGALAWATVGFCQAEGGQPEDGARALLEAADAALKLQLEDGARRLAAAAVKIFPSADTRAAAARISRAAVSVDGPRPKGDRISLRAVHALMKGDVESVERALDMAVAEGRDLAATDRVRAMAFLARGDTASAMAAMARARNASEGNLKSRTRDALTLAWIFLQSGEVEHCVRAALDALAAARRTEDERGEAAALKTLASAYARVQRSEDEALLVAAGGA